ncbi:MAG: hypothetical protein Q8909_17205 [Bacteroidota bacterium]|nr:hypothetical protein [Bacteroidota bacterium]
MEKINPSKLINREMTQRRISKSELARMLHMKPSSIHFMLDSEFMQVQRLLDLSNVLQYNFFREIADQLPHAEPATVNPATAEIATLNEHIKELEMEVRILRETLDTLVRK